MSYIFDLRKLVGNQPLYVPSAGGYVYKDGKILLQRRKDDGLWAINGGCLEMGETFEQALVRELKEELGITVTKARPVAVLSGEKEYHVYPNGDKVYGIDAVFQVDEYEGEPTPDHDEVLEIGWFELDNLPENMHIPDKNFVKNIRKFIDNNEIKID